MFFARNVQKTYTTGEVSDRVTINPTEAIHHDYDSDDRATLDNDAARIFDCLSKGEQTVNQVSTLLNLGIFDVTKRAVALNKAGLISLQIEHQVLAGTYYPITEMRLRQRPDFASALIQNLTSEEFYLFEEARNAVGMNRPGN